MSGYDALLVLSFGGPESRDEVIPFLENVLRGRNVPRERLLEVAEHYYHFDGRTPINDHNRELIAALAPLIPLPIYWGNRNWHPMLSDTMRQMRTDGVKRALCFVTSAFSSYSGCRQYREDIAGAQSEIGDGAPSIDKLRVFFNHPGFIETMIDRVRAIWPTDGNASLVFTAHSIPLAMAEGSRYVPQLESASKLVAGAIGARDWSLVWQSRSGPPTQPWLEPDIADWLRACDPTRPVVCVPIGFLSDHMEVIWDLDTEAKQVADALGLDFRRAGTAGTHPRFIRMIAEMVEEKLSAAEPLALGPLGLEPGQCSENCCPAPRRPTTVGN